MPKPKKISDLHRPLIQLWTLRLLKEENNRRSFVCKSELRQEFIALSLDLNHWLECDSVDYCANKIAAELDERLDALEKKAPQLSPLCMENCRSLSQHLGLKAEEREWLGTLVILTIDPVVDAVLRFLNINSRTEWINAVATMLGKSPQKIKSFTDPGAKLVSSSLAKWNSGFGHHGFRFEFCSGPLCHALLNQEFDLNSLLRALLKPAPLPTLRYRDYPHLKDFISDIRQYLRLALRTKRPGVNIFVHGAPGTGKSELSRIIAREMRAPLYEVTFENEEGDPIDGSKRLESLRAAQALLQKQRALLVFDEAEDVFRGEGFFGRSLASKRKAWMNRGFETNEIPTFWISNSCDLDSAFLRRFDFIVELKEPPKSQKLKCYRRICGTNVSASLLEKIAHYEPLTVGVVAKASEVTQTICAKAPPEKFEATLMRQIRNTLLAQGVDTKRLDRATSELPHSYHLKFLNCGMPLETLPASLLRNASCRLCLYGPPGTGKTTLGYWLAQQTRRKIHVKKASDLLGPFLGQTEAKIAAAFAEASENKAILMIDEVDSFLQDRGQAVRGWEVQQVNEFLTQMEQFEGTFIASTNLMEGMDQAALRRFDLKLRFDYLSADQARQMLVAFCQELKLGPPLQEDLAAIASLTNATPGDFANCRRQSRFRNFPDPAALVAAVVGECHLKANQGSRPLGFTI